MITNMHHVGEGRVRFTLKSGRKISTEVRLNDRRGEAFGIEVDEGFFDILPYADIAHATVPLHQGAVR